MGFFKKLKDGLKKTRESVVGQIDSMLQAFTVIDDELFDELEELLVMGDVGVETANKICGMLRVRVREKGITKPAKIMDEIAEISAELLSGGNEMVLNTTPSIILVIGVNGVGKTTSIGKLASRLKVMGRRVIICAGDTFRAAAADQLTVWAERANVPIIKHREGADPAAVVFDGIQAAKGRHADVLLVDTAGRLHNKAHLMEELKKINRVCEREFPEAALGALLVIDATTGQNGMAQAKVFSEVSNLEGIILTKLDGTAKGGIAIAIRNELGLPVRYIGVGEQLDDMQPFDAKEFVSALFGD
jgi:fused signal recognition particle receptor